MTIDEIIEKWTKDYFTSSGDDDVEWAMESFLSDLKQLKATMGWINIDNPPDEKDKIYEVAIKCVSRLYDCYGDRVITLAEYDIDGNWFNEGDGAYLNKLESQWRITHWRELPELPDVNETDFVDINKPKE